MLEVINWVGGVGRWEAWIYLIPVALTRSLWELTLNRLFVFNIALVEDNCDQPASARGTC